eukprot:scaffold10399_cov113-Cylindrotheca_fusiformis.AAC.9
MERAALTMVKLMIPSHGLEMKTCPLLRFHHDILEMKQQANQSKDQNTSIRLWPPCGFCKHDNCLFSDKDYGYLLKLAEGEWSFSSVALGKSRSGPDGPEAKRVVLVDSNSHTNTPKHWSIREVMSSCRGATPAHHLECCSILSPCVTMTTRGFMGAGINRRNTAATTCGIHVYYCWNSRRKEIPVMPNAWILLKQRLQISIVSFEQESQ